MPVLEIEWRHFEKENNTCTRCSNTGQTLARVVAKLAEECRPQGWEIQFKETLLTENEISDSNMIRVNGQPIEQILKHAVVGKSLCPSCCQLIGKSATNCRTIELAGRVYESIPAHLIRGAVCAVAQCC
jgi:hypothetical protein